MACLTVGRRRCCVPGMVVEPPARAMQHVAHGHRGRRRACGAGWGWCWEMCFMVFIAVDGGNGGGGGPVEQPEVGPPPLARLPTGALALQAHCMRCLSTPGQGRGCDTARLSLLTVCTHAACPRPHDGRCIMPACAAVAVQVAFWRARGVARGDPPFLLAPDGACNARMC